ncbi:hypothetical protein T439DRAFT_97072 [Meredithblackwellia eburnea MCA 4105]
MFDPFSDSSNTTTNQGQGSPPTTNNNHHQQERERDVDEEEERRNQEDEEGEEEEARQSFQLPSPRPKQSLLSLNDYSFAPLNPTSAFSSPVQRRASFSPAPRPFYLGSLELELDNLQQDTTQQHNESSIESIWSNSSPISTRRSSHAPLPPFSSPETSFDKSFASDRSPPLTRSISQRETTLTAKASFTLVKNVAEINDMVQRLAERVTILETITRSQHSEIIRLRSVVYRPPSPPPPPTPSSSSAAPPQSQATPPLIRSKLQPLAPPFYSPSLSNNINTNTSNNNLSSSAEPTSPDPSYFHHPHLGSPFFPLNALSESIPTSPPRQTPYSPDHPSSTSSPAIASHHPRPSTHQWSPMTSFTPLTSSSSSSSASQYPLAPPQLTSTPVARSRATSVVSLGLSPQQSRRRSRAGMGTEVGVTGGSMSRGRGLSVSSNVAAMLAQGKWKLDQQVRSFFPPFFLREFFLLHLLFFLSFSLGIPSPFFFCDGPFFLFFLCALFSFIHARRKLGYLELTGRSFFVFILPLSLSISFTVMSYPYSFEQILCYSL